MVSVDAPVNGSMSLETLPGDLAGETICKLLFKLRWRISLETVWGSC